MLKQNLTTKTIAIIGYSTLVGRLVLKKIIEMAINPKNIICIELGKDQLRRSKFLIDPFFTLQEQTFLNQIAFVQYTQLPVKLKQLNLSQIDVLFNLLERVDFSNTEKYIQYHLVNTSKITQVLQQLNILKCVCLSSIYYREPGFIPEEEEIGATQIKQSFIDKQDARNYLKDHFVSNLERWRWTINFVEKNYSRVCKSIVILRVPSLGPTITNFQGYSLKFSYFTYLVYQLGAGLIKNIHGNKKNKVDIVPYDFASNLLVVLAAKNFNSKVETLNLSTSNRNFVTLQQFLEYGRLAWIQYGEKAPKITVTQSQLNRKLRQKSQKLPSEVKKRLGALMDVKSWKIQGVQQSLEIEQKLNLLDKYHYFLSQQWLCQSIKTIDLFNQLSPEDQIKYNFNVNTINWKSYVRLCVYSIKKYLLGQHIQQFKPQNLDLLDRESHPYFSDIMWALKEGRDTKGQNSREAVQHVLNSKAVKQAVKSLVEQQMLKLQGSRVPYQKAEQQLMKVAEEICLQMFSDYNMKSIRIFAWFLHKVFGNIYEKVVVNKTSLSKLQAHNQQTQGPLIIIPTHRSYIDFLIMSYVFFSNGIKCPHIAAAEDFLNMAVVHILLRKSGAFFIKRNQKKYKELYKAIMGQYISKLVGSNHYLQFFIQGTRSRTGKMLPPKFGMLSLVANNVAEGRVIDAHILPVTINYEKVLEGISFTYEMMGEAKVKESLSRLLKAADVLKENFGRIYLQFCETISVKKWLSDHQGSFAQKVEKLGNKIVHDLAYNLVITGPAIVSSIVLMNRKGISDDTLQEKTSWLCKQITSRNIKIARSQSDSSISINSTLGLFGGILQKSKKNMFQVQVNFDQNSFIKLFTLTYYRNTLTHIFFQEAIIATALISFGYQNIISKNIRVEQLYKRTSLLWLLLQNQFYLPEPLNNENRFKQVLNVLLSKNIIKLEEGFVIACDLTGNYYNFYWSLVWPVVETYWITCLYLYKLLKNKSLIPTAKFHTEIQWFAQSLITERISTHLESLSSDTIKNAVGIFIKMKLIASIKQESDGQEILLIKINAQQPILKKMLQTIETFLKNTYAKSIQGILQSGQGSVNIDFPFLSKL